MTMRSAAATDAAPRLLNAQSLTGVPFEFSHELFEFPPPFPRQPYDHLLPFSRRAAVARCIRRQSHLPNSLRLKPECLRQLRSR